MLQQFDVVDGNGRELGQLCSDILVLLAEFAFFLVRQLQHAYVGAVASDQRHRQPAAHGRVLVGVFSKPAPARMCLQLSLREAHGLIGFTHPCIDTTAVRLFHPFPVGRILFRERKTVDGLSPVIADAEAGNRLMGAHDAACFVSHDLHHGLNGSLLGDDLGGVGCALQCFQVGLNLLLGPDALGNIKRHREDRIPPAVPDFVPDHLDRKLGAILATLNPLLWLVNGQTLLHE